LRTRKLLWTIDGIGFLPARRAAYQQTADHKSGRSGQGNEALPPTRLISCCVVHRVFGQLSTAILLASASCRGPLRQQKAAERARPAPTGERGDSGPIVT